MADLEFFRNKKVYDKEQLTVSTSALGGTESKIDQVDSNGPINFKASAATAFVVTNNVYYTFDGTTPSASNGEIAYAGDRIAIAGYQKVKNFRMLRTAGSDATVNMTYYKE